MSGHRVLVNAVEHPEVDDWVYEQAHAQAAADGLTLGDYLGREDVLGEARPSGMCCHVFDAHRADAQ